jgi:hypothetical protein
LQTQCDLGFLGSGIPAIPKSPALLSSARFLQRRECGLIEIGRQHARNFDAGHFPSGGGMQRVLTELRRLAEHMASPAATTATPVRSELDDIRARCAGRLTDAADREHPARGH